jgi:BirA family biotin operon repressor/biotin-[acetyl-CoA-carboxylase] ligase
MAITAETHSLIQLLADGAVHSGTSLGQALGISRAGVWKRVSRLADLGLTVNRVRTQGYQLSEPIELLDPSRISMALSDGHDDRRVVVLESVDSTNQQALSLARSCRCPNGTAILAEHQTLGRGRRGRSWVSPYGRNLYCSVVWQFDEGVSALSGLSLVAGIAVARVLRQDFGAPVMLKWPNDIVIDGAKLGGILVDVDGDLAGPVTAIIGIGLNVNMSADQGAVIAQAWTDLDSTLGERVSRNLLAARVIAACRVMIAEFARSSFSVYRQEWNSLNAMRGMPVVVETAGEPFAAVAGDVDGDGALLVTAADGLRRIIGGEVSVRRIE